VRRAGGIRGSSGPGTLVVPGPMLPGLVLAVVVLWEHDSLGSARNVGMFATFGMVYCMCRTDWLALELLDRIPKLEEKVDTLGGDHPNEQLLRTPQDGAAEHRVPGNASPRLPALSAALDVPPRREQARDQATQRGGHVLLAGLGLDVLGAGFELDGLQAA